MLCKTQDTGYDTRFDSFYYDDLLLVVVNRANSASEFKAHNFARPAASECTTVTHE
jgi:hypothetical protein